MKLLTRILIIAIVFAQIIESVSVDVQALNKTSVSTQRVEKKNKSYRQQSKNKHISQKTKSKKQTNSDLSSSKIQQQQENTKKEIKKTEEEIRQNDLKIKSSLAELNRINTEIAVSQTQLNTISDNIISLNDKIQSYSKQIAQGEIQLKILQDEYLRAIKKMRLKKCSINSLTFIFSSANFYQALRRLRYLRQFSEWKQKQSERILKAKKELVQQQQQLTQTKQKHNLALRQQTTIHTQLAGQQKQQNLLVDELRKNGSALREHLARKQQEANMLNNKIASAIAREQEQRKREEERQIKIANERTEAKHRQEDEAQRRQKQQRNTKKETSKDTKIDNSNKQEDKQPNKIDRNKLQKDYAQARNRKPRNKQDAVKTEKNNNLSSETGLKNSEKASVKQDAKTSGFASAKGMLPSPSSAGFTITSRFGRHSHPNFPGVEYDNPGIDATTSGEASAQAVYQGKVTGIYVLGGYHTVVIINHGDYYTVYGNLSSASVKQGDMVKAGQKLGKLYTDPDSKNTQIHFEVWQGRTKLNPADWIR